MFIAMPSRRSVDNEYRDIAHPINPETRERIQKLILQKYEENGAHTSAEQEQGCVD